MPVSGRRFYGKRRAKFFVHYKYEKYEIILFNGKFTFLSPYESAYILIMLDNKDGSAHRRQDNLQIPPSTEIGLWIWESQCTDNGAKRNISGYKEDNNKYCPA